VLKKILSSLLYLIIINLNAKGIEDKDDSVSNILDLPDWTAAISAYNDGLSDVAVNILAKINARPDLSNNDEARVRSLLVENLVRAGKYQEAIDTIKGDELKFWRGIAYAGLGKVNKALPLVEEYLIDPDSPLHSSSVLSITSAYESLKMNNRALEVIKDSVTRNIETGKNIPVIKFKLASLYLLEGKYDDTIKSIDSINSNKKQIDNLKNLILSKAHFKLDKLKESEEILRKVEIEPNKRTPQLHISIELLRFDIQYNLNKVENAISTIRSAIESAPNDCDTSILFEKLLFANDTFSDQIDSILQTWIKSENKELSRNSQYFYIKKNKTKEPVEAISTLKKLSIENDDISLKSKILQSRILIEQGNMQEAIETLSPLENSVENKSTKSEINFLLAEAHKENKDLRSATESYLNITDSTNLNGAAFNAALADLMDSEIDHLIDPQILTKVKDNYLKGNLILERGLLLAAEQNANAKKAIEEFIDLYPKHERIAEAHLAITSLILLESPVDFELAKASLVKANNHAVKTVDKERLDYLRFWLEENSSNPQSASTIADEFVKKWPNSSYSPEIRMRQAELYYTSKDFSKALLNFEKLYTDYPNSILATRARYYAAHAARLTLTDEGISRAFSLFQKVADSDDALSEKARLEQAKIKLNKNHNDEAIIILDAIIKSESSTKVKTSALMLKGKSLYELGATSADKITEAIRTFDQVLSMQDLKINVRNEAIFRKAKSYEFIAQNTKSLELYYQILTAPRPPLLQNERPEMIWHYKAGFECIRILTTRGTPQDLRAAVIISDQLSEMNGPRSSEARAISERLKLENFIWDD